MAPPRASFDEMERRRRIGRRHRLAEPAGTVGEAAEDLVGVHASDPASVYLGFRARTRSFERSTLAGALYEERSLLRVLAMRRTMFVMPVRLAGIAQSAVTSLLASAERRRLVRMLSDANVDGEAEDWLERVEAATIEALERRGEATAGELRAVVPGLRTMLSFGAGRSWAGTVGVSTRLLFLLATEGRIIRGEPRGSWLSSQYRWAPMDRWVEGGLEDWPVDRARVELARRWLRSYGPGTLRDLRWWTGWTVAATRRALVEAGAAEVDVSCDGVAVAGFALPDDLEPTPQPEPWVALLPALDTTTMGWAERSFFLGNAGPRLFDRNGNAGPTVWRDGRVVGGWAQRADGAIVHRLFEDVGMEARRAIGESAARLEACLDGSRIVPRFRTPLEVELSS